MYKQIVVGTDGSDRAAQAVDHAAKLAATTGATLHVAQGCGSSLRMAPMHGEVIAIDPRAILEACTAELQLLADRVGAQHDVTTAVHVHPMESADALVAVAEEIGADVIVCGNRRVNGMSRVLGSVARAILGRASCAVLVVDTS